MTRLYADDEMICEMPDHNDMRVQHHTNCRNCGAPLPRYGKCLYCDTENNRNAANEPFESLHTEMDTTAKNTVVTCLRDKLNPYMQSVEYRDVKGRLHRKVVDLRE